MIESDRGDELDWIRYKQGIRTRISFKVKERGEMRIVHFDVEKKKKGEKRDREREKEKNGNQ